MVISLCHIAGYLGDENAISLILESLALQEPIIGGQATGLAYLKDGRITMDKEVGSVQKFKQKSPIIAEQATHVIGHTRYALKNLTYAATNTNAKAHPFWNSTKEFVTMHNGTIVNFSEIIAELEEKGYIFKSKSVYFNETSNSDAVDFCDSELFSYLLEEELRASNELILAIRQACKDIKGHFLFVILHPDYPQKIFIANWMQPLSIAYTKKATFFSSFSSGLQPFMPKKPSIVHSPINSLVILSAGGVAIEPLLSNRKPPEYMPIAQDLKKAIIKAIAEGYHSLGRIWLYIKEHSSLLGLPQAKYDALSTFGGFTFSPSVYKSLISLEQQKVVERKLEFVWEGGIADTPRFQFYLKKQ
jgi:glucosamine 6-phosphate synthetase-like amidotransferase/phosphosugar isomerase protein